MTVETKSHHVQNESVEIETELPTSENLEEEYTKNFSDNKCCHRFDLRKGLIFWGCFDILLSLALLIAAAVNQTGIWSYFFFIGVMIVYILFNIQFIYGVKNYILLNIRVYESFNWFRIFANIAVIPIAIVFNRPIGVVGAIIDTIVLFHIIRNSQVFCNGILKSKQMLNLKPNNCCEESKGFYECCLNICKKD